ncbi:MAG: iron-sulfur cluster assembly protein [Prevotellaceae bacterium]|jgi:FeS assembly SUF system protein|nr:iron-sulfur cluster assembly protein [Prevotellaceae bacterium]
MDKFEIEHNIVKALKNIYDPEIPVNIYDLGLIYEVNADENGKVSVTMTLTAPNCPMADELLADVSREVGQTPGVTDVEVILTFEPPWTQDKLSEEARLELGLM